jgi:hypothetical protein
MVKVIRKHDSGRKDYSAIMFEIDEDEVPVTGTSSSIHPEMEIEENWEYIYVFPVDWGIVLFRRREGCSFFS